MKSKYLELTYEGVQLNLFLKLYYISMDKKEFSFN